LTSSISNRLVSKRTMSTQCPNSMPDFPRSITRCKRLPWTRRIWIKSLW
jgi:hypothetical protein